MHRSATTWLALLPAASLLMLAGSAPVPLDAVEVGPAAADVQLPRSRALNSPPVRPAVGGSSLPDTAAVLEAARAWFPASVGGGERQRVDLSRYERAPEVVEVSATYDHPGMPYVIEASFYAPGDPSLEKKMEKMQELGGKEPYTTHQGIPVYKWPFEAMGSGVGLRLQGKLDVWVEVDSPRLTEEMRKKGGGEKFPAPPPEAGLEKLDVKGEAFQNLMSEVVAAFGTGDR